MADIVVTADKVGLIDATKAEVTNYIATETITRGQAIYRLTTGKAGVADANAGGKQQFRGIALNGAGAGQAVAVCEDGELSGFTVTGNADALIYLSDTAGALADGVGTMTVPAGRIVVKADKDLTKIIRVSINKLAQWA